jgi:hypothetical protein
MLYMDYSLVRVRQAARVQEMARTHEQDQLLSNSNKGSNPVAGRTLEKLGNGFIRVGERLIDAGNGHANMKIATFDCD